MSHVLGGAMASPIPLAVFAKAPRPGHAKTRLIPAVGADAAAALQRAFAEDTLAHCLEAGAWVPTLWCAGDVEHPALVRIAGGRQPRPQPPGDLGQRMAAALADGLGQARYAAVIGTDAPTLPGWLLRAAAAALEHAELVIGPAADGGYCLLAVRERVPPVFDGVQWSSARVLEQTLARAAAAGVRTARLPPWYDVDEPDDLRLLRAHLALDPSAAPATARLLASMAPGSPPSSEPGNSRHPSFDHSSGPG